MGIRCGWARERLGRYRDGDLPEGERARMERHLARCVPCRAYLAQEESARAALAQLGPEAYGPANAPAPPFAPRLAAAAAALLLLAWVNVWASRWSLTPPPPPPHQQQTQQAFISSVMEDLGEYDGIAEYVKRTTRRGQRPTFRICPVYRIDEEEPWT